MTGEFHERSGAPVPLCPRSILQQAVEYGAENGLTFLLGFEIEFVLLERVEKTKASSSNRYTPLTTDGHCWAATRYFADLKVSKLLRDMVVALDEMGIYVEQIHAESANGQFELILPPYPPVQAVDILMHTRDAMNALATEAGYRMTLHPKPFPQAVGTALHTHMSISSTSSSSAATSGDNPQLYESYYAGILKHLRAITAFTYASPASFDRLADGVWAGGRWIGWGTQNRETPLRKIEDSHWEFRAIDGMANPYFAMAAVLAAGAHGVVAKEKLTWRDCEIDPAKLTENDRKEVGVFEKLPGSVEEALDALKEDEELVGWLGAEFVEKYIVVKEFELDYLGRMSEDDKRQWLMERY